MRFETIIAVLHKITLIIVYTISKWVDDYRYRYLNLWITVNSLNINMEDGDVRNVWRNIADTNEAVFELLN